MPSIAHNPLRISACYHQPGHPFRSVYTFQNDATLRRYRAAATVLQCPASSGRDGAGGLDANGVAENDVAGVAALCLERRKAPQLQLYLPPPTFVSDILPRALIPAALPGRC